MKQTSSKVIVIENEYGNGRKSYSVKFVTTIFKKNIFGERTNVIEKTDKIVFSSKIAAEKYAEIMVKPSNQFKVYYTHYATIENNFCRIIQVFPKDYEKLWEYGKYIAYFQIDNCEENFYAMIDDSALDNSSESVQDDFYQHIDKKQYLYIDTKFMKHRIVESRINVNYIENILENFTYKSTPIKTFTKYDLGSVEDENTNELSAARTELIQKEIERIDKYKEFLLSFK